MKHEHTLEDLNYFEYENTCTKATYSKLFTSKAINTTHLLLGALPAAICHVEHERGPGAGRDALRIWEVDVADDPGTVAVEVVTAEMKVLVRSTAADACCPSPTGG